MREADIARHAKRQRDILDFAARAVRPAGRLVYATCSLFPEENESVVEAFLESHPAFVPEPFAHPLTGDTHENGRVQVWPWDADCDAMFIARMRRKKDA
jgi:16S rRNA (cytosine967-C5)-methyltransferase